MAFINDTEDIRQFYKISKLIGTGSFGTVKLGHHIETPDRAVAIKSILKEKVKKKEVLERELNTLKKLDHPNIIKFYETYDDGKYVHFVMEYYAGGDLFERLESPNEPMITEDQVKTIMHKLIKTVLYMHKKNIVHRDLKLENILLNGPTFDADIKIIDFGLSTFINENEMLNLHSKVGTPLYVAPEVHDGIYKFECDVWSLGVILYFLLATEPPFLAANLKDTYALAKAGIVEFNEEIWKFYSDEAKDLILKMLKVQINERITLKKALLHPWFKTKINSKMAESKINFDKINKRLIRNITCYSASSRLKKEALKYLAN